MITKSELTSNRLKKGLGAYRVAYRWHNKNKSGGNFGINIYYGKEFLRGRDKELTGEYNTSGIITGLRYGDLYSAGHNVPQDALSDMEALIIYLRSNRDY